MKSSTYRDMSLLQEVSQTPEATQRELSKRIGVALGLTNLMLRRLAKKGYIKISGTKRSRIRYLITPKGIFEKSRLTYEYVQYSLQLYSRVRHFLYEQLAFVAQLGERRVLLCGTDELAEIAYLTIREMGLELVGVVDEPVNGERFLSYPVQKLSDVGAITYDRLIVASQRVWEALMKDRVAFGLRADRIIVLSVPGQQPFSPESVPVGGLVNPPSPITAIYPPVNVPLETVG